MEEAMTVPRWESYDFGDGQYGFARLRTPLDPERIIWGGVPEQWVEATVDDLNDAELMLARAARILDAIGKWEGCWPGAHLPEFEGDAELMRKWMDENEGRWRPE